MFSVGVYLNYFLLIFKATFKTFTSRLNKNSQDTRSQVYPISVSFLLLIYQSIKPKYTPVQVERMKGVRKGQFFTSDLTKSKVPGQLW